MPQPPFEIQKYLSKSLPTLREQYPPGTGGTGPRAEWDGPLKGIEVIDDFNQKVLDYWKTIPQEPVQPHPNFKYPKIAQVISSFPDRLKSPRDLQSTLAALPLAANSAILTALDADPADLKAGAKALDAAGYESDGGEEPEVLPQKDVKTKGWVYKFSKSPLGSGEFLLTREGSDEVALVVRTINSSAFTPHDWDEYIATGPYHYETKSKASWYWSRSYGATKRLGCQYYVLTDWQRWTFGYFNKDGTRGWTSPVLHHNEQDPTIGHALFYWARSAIGKENGFANPKEKDLSGAPELFPANPSRRISQSGDRRPKPPAGSRTVKKANESDIEESDAEGDV
ncbi:hypothetical protein L198_01556 [Cryptococcus wingfieldii CBS 7118]|uniref:Uncharacterized protein n=1 Tax=Cryptococcus wingfieldii CBS 7118 TaxID=1295528 RepID=A0A1E3JZM7_9TREE|nr:hypothetical protein L198_01556 [Cryptococcus wingfieldii CBS 7118]ODO06324.1 hypothetical protein L198_01556 [Cryptococcus wingfieldii CBS 7118]